MTRGACVHRKVTERNMELQSSPQDKIPTTLPTASLYFAVGYGSYSLQMLRHQAKMQMDEMHEDTLKLV